MPTMRHSNSVANLHDKQQLHQRSASKMKMSRSAPDLLKKAMTSIKSKTDALRTKLIILVSMRRRMAMVAAMSRKVHTTLVSSSSQEKIAAADHHRDRPALVLSKAVAPPSKELTAGDHGGKMAGLSLFEIAVFDEEDRHGYHDWTRSLFDDDNFHCNDDEEDDGDADVLGALDDEPSQSVIEVIRSNREAEGLKFNLDDEIDEACDMFIRRCRSRMDLSL